MSLDFYEDVIDEFDNAEPKKALGIDLFPENFLENVCDRLGIEAQEERASFIIRIAFVSWHYQHRVEINTNRIPKYEQIRKLEKYKKALQETKCFYQEIQDDVATSGKFRHALREQVEKISEPGVKEMFYPYCDDKGSIAVSLFEKFLDELIDVAGKAQEVEIGHDKTDISSELLIWWMRGVKRAWPLDGKIVFGLGNYVKEFKEYKSPSLDILCDLLRYINPQITKNFAATTMRKAIKIDKYQEPADFLPF